MPPSIHDGHDTIPPCDSPTCPFEDRIEDLERDIGKPPDPTGDNGERTGSGLKAAYARILDELKELRAAVEALAKKPEPPAAGTTWGKRLGWAVIVLAIAAQEARSIYTQIAGARAAQLPQTTQRNP